MLFHCTWTRAYWEKFTCPWSCLGVQLWWKIYAQLNLISTYVYRVNIIDVKFIRILACSCWIYLISHNLICPKSATWKFNWIWICRHLWACLCTPLHSIVADFSGLSLFFRISFFCLIGQLQPFPWQMINVWSRQLCIFLHNRKTFIPVKRQKDGGYVYKYMYGLGEGYRSLEYTLFYVFLRGKIVFNIWLFNSKEDIKINNYLGNREVGNYKEIKRKSVPSLFSLKFISYLVFKVI